MNIEQHTSNIKEDPGYFLLQFRIKKLVKRVFVWCFNFLFIL